MWIAYALISAVFAAAVAILGKIGLKTVDTTLATAIRAAVMGIFMISAALILGKLPMLKTVDNKTLLFIIYSGIAGALSWLFYFFALKYGPASGVAALDRLSVVFVVILAALFLGEAITLKSGIGLAFIISGALLLVFK
ncbi:MAG: EamA family transporter [Candidatus Zambryskibacteria bacterium]|nr:EamA family transporter [Candidatus Zambryskibacteria bacterium]